MMIKMTNDASRIGRNDVGFESAFIGKDYTIQYECQKKNESFFRQDGLFVGESLICLYNFSPKRCWERVKIVKPIKKIIADVTNVRRR